MVLMVSLESKVIKNRTFKMYKIPDLLLILLPTYYNSMDEGQMYKTLKQDKIK